MNHHKKAEDVDDMNHHNGKIENVDDMNNHHNGKIEDVDDMNHHDESDGMMEENAEKQNLKDVKKEKVNTDDEVKKLNAIWEVETIQEM